MIHRYLNPIHLAGLKKKELDLVAYIVIGFLFLITFPQAITIYLSNDATGVSIFTWGGFTIVSVFWLIYGIERKAHPIIVSSMLYIAVDLFIVIGIIKYS